MERCGGPFYGVEFDALYNPRTGAHVTTAAVGGEEALNFRIPCMLNYDPTVTCGGSAGVEDKPKFKKKEKKVIVKGREKEVKGHEMKEKKKVKGQYQGTRIKWDLGNAVPPPTQAVEYGEELYNAAVKNVLEKKKDPKSPVEVSDVVDGCKDLSVPAFNSSLGRTSALSRAVETFKALPEEVDRMFRADRRFDPLVSAEASKALNVPLRGVVYKDLVDVSSVPEEVSKSLRSAISSAIHNSRPPSKAVDPAPSLLDYEQPTFSRMKPSGLPPVIPPLRPEVLDPVTSPPVTPGHQMFHSSLSFLGQGERFS